MRMAPAPDKREARRFEPPPWERDRFEELAKRSEQQAPLADENPKPAAAEAVEQAREGEVPREERVPENLEAMLVALRAEEPEALSEAWKVAAGASLVVITIGLMLVVWGAVAMARAGSAGAAGVMGSAIMTVMGALFAALGAWLGVRSLRQRGVL